MTIETAAAGSEASQPHETGSGPARGISKLAGSGAWRGYAQGSSDEVIGRLVSPPSLPG